MSSAVEDVPNLSCLLQNVVLSKLPMIKLCSLLDFVLSGIFFLRAPKRCELCNVAVVSYDPKIAIVNE